MKQEFLQIRIDDELLQSLRLQSARFDKPVSVYVREAIREKLAREAPADVVAFPTANGHKPQTANVDSSQISANPEANAWAKQKNGRGTGKGPHLGI